jgi:hypothetical protein
MKYQENIADRCDRIIMEAEGDSCAPPCSRFKIVGKWRFGGGWESRETFATREAAESRLAEWKEREGRGEFAANETARVVPCENTKDREPEV